MKIYKITNNITSDFYIGKTVQPIEKRWRRHKYNTKSDACQAFLYRAMRKYGTENFTIDIIDIAESVDELNHKERSWISELKPKYNMTDGGDGGDTSSSPNFIASMKRYHQNRDKSSYATYGMLGKKQSKEQKEAISKRNSCPVVCDGIEYPSVGEAQKAHLGISVRKRLDSPNHPTFYRLRDKTLRK